MNHRRALILSAVALSACLMVTAALAEEAPSAAPSNSPPIAQTQEIETCKNVAYTGRLTATDPEGDLITFQLSDKPARGSVEIATDGTGNFVYTPYENKTGKDSFTFVAVDDKGNMSQPAKVSIRIRKPSTKVTYADMAGEASYNAAIKLAEEKVMIGECVGGQYYFHPDAPVSRSEFVTMAMSALELEPLTNVSATGFADDEAIPTWAKGYVSSALRAGVVRGYADQTGKVVFDPDSTVTRAEAAVMIDRLISTTDVAATTFYTDTATAPAWAFQAAVNLETAGVLQTDEVGALALETTLTRGQAAQLLASAMEVVNARESSGWFNW